MPAMKRNVFEARSICFLHGLILAMAVLFPAMTLGVATPVLAQQPIVHLKFDGSLANSGSNGVQVDGSIPTKTGTPKRP